MERPLACAADACMTRPFDALQLQERVRALLARPRAGAARAGPYTANKDSYGRS